MKNVYDYLNDVKIDLSMYEEVKLSEKELNAMKKSINKNKKPLWGKIAALAACAALVAAFSQTALAKGIAKDIWYKITASFSTGKNEYYEMEISDNDLPEEYQIFFDAEGNPIPHDADYDPNMTYYDAEGNEITDVQTYLSEKVKELFPDDYEDIDIDLSFGTVTDSLTHLEESGYEVHRGVEAAEKAADELAFTPILPKELPEGYTLAGSAWFSDSGKYLTLVYSNAEGKELKVYERFMDEETAFSMGTVGTLEETQVNGNAAVLIDGESLSWEIGDLAVQLSTGGNIDRDEIMAMAESFE